MVLARAVAPSRRGDAPASDGAIITVAEMETRLLEAITIGDGAWEVLATARVQAFKDHLWAQDPALAARLSPGAVSAAGARVNLALN